MVGSFAELSKAQQEAAGGKAAVLARLFQSGYPVPDGFVILPAAFAGDTLLAEAWPLVQAQLARLGRGDSRTAVAVRSSALSEDSAGASFAGEFESVLDVAGEHELRQAIAAVRLSRHQARVRAYGVAVGAAHGLDDAGAQLMAVVVQRMVPADLAGVLFTADPVSGSRQRMTGNFVAGLGDRLVSGEANPETFILRRPKGSYEGPQPLKSAARSLFKLGRRLEAELGGPQDVEWALAGGRLYLLQSRPITTLRGHNLATGDWNDSLTGDYLWTKTNFGEAVADVMTPATWAMLQLYMAAVTPAGFPGNIPLAGNIGGRFYINVSLLASLAVAFGQDPRKLMEREGEETFGLIPPDLTIPTVPVSRWYLLRHFLPSALSAFRRVRRDRARLPQFVARTPARSAAIRQAIGAAARPPALAAIWRRELAPAFHEASLMLQASVSQLDQPAARLRHDLTKLVGQADAGSLLSGINRDDAQLASLGPLLGIARVSRGELSRQEFLAQYGHRGPHELEISIPRPAEDPDWLERQLAVYAVRGADVEAMLARQRLEHEAAWQRFQEQQPRQATEMEKRLAQIATAARVREAVRSEGTRLIGVIRNFYLRAGELTALGQDVFFLAIAELLALLDGESSATQTIPARRQTHERYSRLPVYPAIINGRFDPFQWAADPQRRHDLFDFHRQLSAPDTSGDLVEGFAGAAGVVEGVVRRLDDLTQADQLRPGEILVTATTNIGWTPYFPRAAAIVTDVGAPLSHAAIVARELGLPAVVGTGNATMRLQTGDRVRVDGGQGRVTRLSPAAESGDASASVEGAP